MISIVIPVYNKFEALNVLIPKLELVLNKVIGDHEILLVDDGSKDRLFDYLKNNNLLKKNIYIIELDKNYGQVPAIYTGLSLMKGESAIIMASDLQEPLDVIPEFYEKWKSGNDLVIGKRSNTKIPFFSSLFYFFYRINNNKFPIGGYDYGLIDKTVIDKVLDYSPYTLFLQQAFIDNAKDINFVNYLKKNSFYKESSWSFFNKVRYAFLAFQKINIVIPLLLISLLVSIGVFFKYPILLTMVIVVHFIYVIIFYLSVFLLKRKAKPHYTIVSSLEGINL
jgi:glycosyltransferase involved in cell wall biosynthesis